MASWISASKATSSTCWSAVVGRQHLGEGGDRDRGGAHRRIAEHTAADRGERDGPDPVLASEREGAAVAAGEEVGLARTPAAPDGTHGVDDVSSGQPKSGRDPTFSGGAADAGPNLRDGAARLE